MENKYSLYNLDYIKQIPETSTSKEKYRFYLIRKRRSGQNDFVQFEFEYDDPEMLDLIDSLLDKLEINLGDVSEVIKKNSLKKEMQENKINKCVLIFNTILINVLTLPVVAQFLNSIPIEIAEGIGFPALFLTAGASAFGATCVSPWLSDFINSKSRYNKDEETARVIAQKIRLLTNLKSHLTEDFVVEPVDMFEQNEYAKIFDRTLSDKSERIMTELFVRKPKNIRKFKILERLINKKIELVRSKISDLMIDLEDVSSDIKESSDGTILSLRKGRVKNIYLNRLAHRKEEAQEARFQLNQAQENLSVRKNFVVSQIDVDYDKAKKIHEETGISLLDAMMQVISEQTQDVLRNDPKCWELFKKRRQTQLKDQEASDQLKKYSSNELEVLKLIRAELEEYLILRLKIARLQKKYGKLEGFFAKYEPQFGGNVKRK